MAIHNTKSDAANTAVRSFLTSVGEQYWGRQFNTGTGESKRTWIEIKDGVFKGSCAYCGRVDEKLTIEHLVMMNREQFGLHHPGNVVPSCRNCNKRVKGKDGLYMQWTDHLKKVCKSIDQEAMIHERLQRIYNHMTHGKFRYPQLSEAESHSIRIMAKIIYESVKRELDDSLNLYSEIRSAFVKTIKIA